MNIEKIREALEVAEAMADVFDQLSLKLGDLRERNTDRIRLEEIREALAELDKAQQPGRVLTDEEIESIAEHMAPSFPHIPMAELQSHRNGIERGLRYARDNGYLATAAGLTVEEVMEIADDEVVEWKLRTDGLNFRLRLTAAIEAKTRKQ